MKRLLFLFLFLAPMLSMAQRNQTIKGTVVDAETKQPLVGATVYVQLEEMLGASTDIDGQFKLENVPVGRIEVKCTYIGYEPWSSGLTTLTSGKELTLNIALEENVHVKEEVTVTATRDGETRNEMMTISSRSFSIKETQRFAGSINDPGRVALNFPGVTAAQDNDNDVIVRGNSAAGMLWRLEGIDVPNLNHFSRPGSSGGGITALSPHVLGSTDFSTGAFPAEYGNAIAGVFDVNFRNGNTDRHEFMVRAGVIGLNAGAEGPLSKKDDGSSYLFNYRYSTLGILGAMGLYVVDENTSNTYQDLSFKFVLPKTKKARITIFGIGGLSDEIGIIKEDTAEWEIYKHRFKTTFKTNLAVLGVSWTQLLDERSYLKTVIAGTYNDVVDGDDTLDFDINLHPVRDTHFNNTRAAIHSFYNRKLLSKLSLRTGVHADVNFFQFEETKFVDSIAQTVTLIDGSGIAATIQPYAQVKYRPTATTTIVGGLHGLYLSLNHTYSIEPRLSIAQKVGASRFTFGYGLHGQYLPLGSYFTQFTRSDGSVYFPNKDMEMIQSHHFILSYELSFLKHYQFKIEPYFQYLTKLPVSANPESTYMVLNERSGYAKDSLVNKGTGMNYGVDVSIQRYYAKHWFFLVNGSVFSSTYKPLNGKTYSGAYDSRFALSVMGGYEFQFKNSALEVGFRIGYMGGFRYTPLDVAASQAAREEITIDSLAFTHTYRDYFRPDIRVAYRQNKPKYSWTISLDLGNVVDYKNILRQYYDKETNTIEFRYQMGFIPVLAFQVDFFASKGGKKNKEN
ncbi:MAG: carboxypeptidase-like regulatory domain-containing protein [Flavobacteriales bacterium]|nr:carboxypeptidase-like regulatory domain-containing protein [Flavobacteriales bacterium]